MNEAKKVLKRLGVSYLLLAVDVIFYIEIIPDRFPMRTISTMYLAALCTCFILYCSYRTSRRGGQKALAEAISWMMLLLITLRGIKYTAGNGAAPARYVWYMYYIPVLLIPLFLFYISLLVSETENLHIRKKWYWTLAVTIVLILLVLTNDLHGQVFRFQPGFANWDADYSYGPVFFAVNAWQYALYFAAVFTLVRKCRVGSSRKYAWLILLPFAIGIGMILLLITGTMPKLNGHTPVGFPETLCFMAAGVLEVCMQLGLIPTNEGYGKLFRLSSLSAQITDRSGTAVYRSPTAAALTPEQLAVPDGARIGAHTVLRRMELPGGYGFWQDDVTELDRLNRELEDAKERLSEETELIRLQNELREQQAKVEQRSLVYDTIARRTQKQSQVISRLAEEACGSSDAALREINRRKIALLGAYIKRYANLTLLSTDSAAIGAGELALSVSEVLRYLNRFGVPVELVNKTERTVTADAALAVLEAFEALVEQNLSVLTGVTVNVFDKNDGVSCRLTLENLRILLPEDEREKLSLAGVRMDVMQEDGVAYISLALPEGGCGL